MSKSKKLFKSVSIYGFLSFLPLASRFFLFPIFVVYLSPYDYGILGLHATMANLLTIVISFGLDSAFSRLYFDYENNPKGIREVTSTTILGMVFIGGIVSIVLIFFGEPIYRLIFSDSQYTFFPFGVYSLAFAFATSVNAVILLFFRNSDKPTKYLIFSGSTFLLMICCESVVVILLEASAEGVLTSRLIGLLLPSLIFWIFFIKNGMVFSFEKFKSLLRYGSPVFMYILLGFVYLNYDRILISNFLSIEELSLFSVAITIASLLEITLQAIDLAIVPIIYRMYSKVEYKLTDRIFRYEGYILLIVVSLILGLSPLFIFNFTPEYYHSSLSLIPLFIIGYIIRYYYGVYSKILFHSKKVNFLPWINLASGVVLIVSNLILLPRLGLVGGAISMILSRLIMIPLVILLIKRSALYIANLGLVNLLFSIVIPLCLLSALLPDFLGMTNFWYFGSSTILIAMGAILLYRQKELIFRIIKS